MKLKQLLSEINITSNGNLFLKKVRGVIISKSNSGINPSPKSIDLIEKTLNSGNISSLLKQNGFDEISFREKGWARKFGMKYWRAQNPNMGSQLWVPENLSFQIKKAPRKGGFKATLRHEVGHKLWNNLSKEEQEKIKEKYKNHPINIKMKKAYERFPEREWSETYAELFGQGVIK